MDGSERSESSLVVEELVLRGKASDLSVVEEQGGVVIYVLWGKYKEEQGKIHEGFGLQMEDCAGTIQRVPDLSMDAGEVSELAERMNRYKVSKYHFDDVEELTNAFNEK